MIWIQRPSAARGWACTAAAGQVPAFLQLPNGTPLPHPLGQVKCWLRASSIFHNNRCIFRAPSYFRSGLLTQFRSVNQLTKCFAAVVLSMILYAVFFLISYVESILGVQVYPPLHSGGFLNFKFEEFLMGMIGPQPLICCSLTSPAKEATVCLTCECALQWLAVLLRLHWDKGAHFHLQDCGPAATVRHWAPQSFYSLSMLLCVQLISSGSPGHS